MIDYGRRMLTLGPTSRKYSMPEKGHLFFERSIGINHPVKPAPIPHSRVINICMKVRIESS